MDISGIIAAADPTGSKTESSQSQFGKDYNQFLKLLTTQLQNQDPLSPMDSSEFTSQLVQFSSVEQQIRSNDFLHKILTLNTLNMTGFALGYVGLNAYSPGESFTFNAQTPSDMSYSIPAGATSATLSILDANNNVVYSQEAETAPGQHNFVWDGNNNDGTAQAVGVYKIKVGAQDKEGHALSVKTFTSGLVEGVETKEDGTVSLIIDGKLVPVTDVRQASIQKYALQPPAEDGAGDGVDTGEESGT